MGNSLWGISFDIIISKSASPKSSKSTVKRCFLLSLWCFSLDLTEKSIPLLPPLSFTKWPTNVALASEALLLLRCFADIFTWEIFVLKVFMDWWGEKVMWETNERFSLEDELPTVEDNIRSWWILPFESFIRFPFSEVVFGRWSICALRPCMLLCFFCATWGFRWKCGTLFCSESFGLVPYFLWTFLWAITFIDELTFCAVLPWTLEPLRPAITFSVVLCLTDTFRWAYCIRSPVSFIV